MNSALSVSTNVQSDLIPPQSPSPTELADLVCAMAAGDQRGLERFYHLTVGRIFGRALRIVRCRATAEEVAEDVYVQIWQNADTYDPQRATPLAWAMTICHSRALDALRRADKAIVDADPAERQDAIAQQPMVSLQDLLQSKQENAAMRAAIAKLQPEQRQILGLAFFRGLTHYEISAANHMPVGTVKSRVGRALSTLRQELGAA
jgi:RNA polymerase sigma factor (sigma-70 family)